MLIRTFEHKITLAQTNTNRPPCSNIQCVSFYLVKYVLIILEYLVSLFYKWTFFILEVISHSTNSLEGKVRLSKWMNCVTRVLKREASTVTSMFKIHTTYISPHRPLFSISHIPTCHQRCRSEKWTNNFKVRFGCNLINFSCSRC